MTDRPSDEIMKRFEIFHAPGCECPDCAQQEPDENPSEREYKRLVASDNRSIVPLRLWLEAALIAVILAWSAINGFWILTHTW